MKKHIFTLLTLLACTIYPVSAYEYFTIYFSDGTKSEAFYATDVDSICYSKLSIDSIAYDEWQVQEIYTCDSVYRYPLAQIDSLGFKDVDVNKVAEDIAHACGGVTPYFAQSETIEEMAQHLSEIKRLEGIEDAWKSNQTIYVKIKDWGTITFEYISKDEPFEGISFSELPSQIRNRTKRSGNSSHQDYTDEISNMCVINQQYRDEDPDRNGRRDAETDFINYCKAWGFNVDSINNPTPHFFAKDIFDYDYVFLMTHGGYDKKTGLHWLTTGEQLYVANEEGVVDENLIKWIAQDIFDKKYPLNRETSKLANYLSFTWHKELRNGVWVPVYYTTISNKWISLSANNFKHPGKAIIFNTACQSLMGNDSEHDNENLANAFFKRGAGLYLGYNQESYTGHSAGHGFFCGLTSGKSSYSSFLSIPERYSDYSFLSENQKEIVNPKLRYKQNPSYKEDICITHPFTDDVSFSSESSNYMFSANMYSLFQSCNYYKVNSCNEEVPKNTFAFQFSTNPEMSQPDSIPAEWNYDKNTHYMNWEAIKDVSDLEPNTTYYYRAYMNDGYSNCYGDVKSFTTEDDEDTSDYEAYFTLSNDSAITFYYDNKRKERSMYFTDEINRFIYIKSIIRKAVFDSSFSKYHPQWFSFNDCEVLTSVENIKYLHIDGSLSGLFQNCRSLVNLDLKGFDTSNVTSMVYMFESCNSLTDIDLSSFDTSNVTSMGCMFLGCSSLISLDLTSFNTTNVTDMGGMFRGCSSLVSLNLNSFNTANVTSMGCMFLGCSSLICLDLSNFMTANVKSDEWRTYSGMGAMFHGCSSLTSLDLSSFDTSNVTDMSHMFHGCSSLISLDLSSFNTKNVWDMLGMFQDCSSLKTIYADNWKEGWDEHVFYRCNNLVGGKGTKIGENIYGYDADGSPLYYYCGETRRFAHIDGGKDNPGLFTAK